GGVRPGLPRQPVLAAVLPPHPAGPGLLREPAGGCPIVLGAAGGPAGSAGLSGVDDRARRAEPAGVRGGRPVAGGGPRHGPARRAWAVVVLWVTGLGVFFTPYLAANRGTTRDYSDCVAGMPTVHSWLTAADGGRWSETLRPVLPEVYGECRLFCGFALYGL